MSDDVKPDINKAKVRYGTVNKEYGFRLATTAPVSERSPSATSTPSKTAPQGKGKL